jgi:hypothetical protein
MQKQGEILVKKQAAANEVNGLDASFWVSRSLALLCHLAVVAGLVFVGSRHFQHAHAGMAAATFYLLLPYTAFYLLLPYTAFDVGQWYHAWPMALVVWAVAAYRRPALAGFLVGLAASTMYFPVVLFPVWLSFYWRRGAGRFAGAFGLTAAVCLAAIAAVLWIDDDLARAFQSALALPDWQPWRQPIESTQGFWSGIHWAYRMPVFLGYLALVATTLFWPSPKNLAHLLALSAAVLLGIQFWYADQGGSYVLWYLPLLLLMMFRPNLSERRPPEINRETDWLYKSGRAVGRLAMRLVSPPEPLARVR